MPMASQTLTALVLPAGIAPGGGLRAHIYLSPRLSGAVQLASFPDWLAWPDLIQRHGLTFDLQCGSNTATVAVAQAPLRPDVWREIFPPETRVASYPQPGYSQRLLVSYPARDAHAFVKFAYLFAATTATIGESRGLFDTVLHDLSFRDGAESFLDAVLSQRRITMWQQQQDTGEPVLEAAPAPSGTPATVPLAPPGDTRPMIEQFALYHHLPSAENRPPLPSTPTDFARLLDFHQALSSLAAHPPLLPPLGLVFPVELPGSLCPPSPGTGATEYQTVTVTGVNPGWAWSDPPVLASVATAYVRDGSSFAAAPATGPEQLQAGQLGPADIVDGFLVLDPEFFQLIDVDIDGALLKAMTLADNMAAVRDQSLIEQVLPSLRSAGLSLIASGRAQQLLQAIRDSETFESALAQGTSPRPFNARDLTRGYRLDIWSARTSRWHSLHRRDGTYRFGPGGALAVDIADEEGFTQLAVVQPADDPTRKVDEQAAAAGVPQPGTDLYVNERIARWNGWGLSAPRPGTPLNRDPDPSVATDPDPTAGEPATPFKMTTEFTARPGSLPRLRFGDRYRMRARAVDLAGHSPGLAAAAADQFAAPADEATLPYLRYEPVGHPVLVQRTAPGPGGSLAQLAIRSRNSDPSLDTAATAEADERHVAPPRAAVLLVEQHGMLDDSHGGPRGDAATYQLIVKRDQGQFPTVDGEPTEPGGQLTLPYFPDPLGRGAALAGLPHVPDGTEGVITGGALSYQAFPDVVPYPGSVTRIGFGPDWPGRQPFRIRIVEGTGVPAWDDPQRVLTIPLAKAESVTVGLSCFVDPPDLDLLGLWDWIRVLYEDYQAAVLTQGGSGSELVELADQLALLTRLVLQGGHEMITPQLDVTLVHAVQQPLGRPEWERLPIVHHPESPVAVAALDNSFWQLNAWRYVGSHTAVLLGALRISGRSSTAIDIVATWTEWTDDPAEPTPTRSAAAAAVDRVTIGTLDAGPIAADGSGDRLVAVYIPEVDTLWFAAPFDELPGVTPPPAVAAPVHALGDTRHRCINYRAVASSRFQEYFTQPGLDFTRTSDPVMVDVPSSARPLVPDVLYVLPTYGWERQESTNLKTDVRFGNGLRVYLNRPWYSSGEGELLGVVLWPGSQAPPDDSLREADKEIFTQWGLDPIWQTGSIGVVPAVGDLTAATRPATGLTIEESAQTVDVAGHPVAFDPDRRLWYCDVVFENPGAYAPFVRLALARYQPSSIPGVELSHVVLADFAQLAPDRSASLAVNPADPARARLVVGGLAPGGPTQPYLTVTVEARLPTVMSELGWTEAPASAVSVNEDTPAPSLPQSVLWSGTIDFATAPQPGAFRVVIREFEVIEIDPPVAAASDQPVYGGRLVYASILPFDFAQKAPA
jgi:hypothetical protein